MTGVQVIGKQALLDRYNATGCEAWALFQGKQFLIGGVGYDELDSWLTSFDEGGTTATYTIRMYDDNNRPTAATAGGDYIACLQFKLQDPYHGMGIGGHSTALMQRLADLEKKTKDPGEDDDESQSLGAIITGWLKDPSQLAQVAGIFKMFTGGAGAAVPAVVPAQAIGAVAPGSGADIDKLAGHLDVLGERDPKIVEHLGKLAKLSQDNPDLFNTVLSQIDLL